MSIYSMEDLRAQAPENLRGSSDRQLIEALASANGKRPEEVAQYLGFGQSGGLASNRIGAGIDNYQANLYGLGEAVSGAAGLTGVSKALGRRRQDNEFEANVSSQRASELGGIDDWRDVDGIGSAANYVGGLAAQSLPYLGEAVVGGVAARGLMTGTRAALQGAQTVEAATKARKALNLGSMAGAAGASYPSAVGDILSNQRDENGTTDLGSAAIGGVPYAALNAVGVEGIVARGLRPLSQGGGDLLKRVGVTAGTTALTEGASETGQEVVNQYFGRMAVNPEQTLFNDEANDRYLDSFVGGAALGGVFGGAAGVRRPTNEGDLLKTNEPAPPAPEVDQGPVGQLGYDGRAGEIISFEDGSSELRSVLEAQGDFPRRPPEPVPPEVQAELEAKAQADAAAAERKQAIMVKIEQTKQEAIAKEQAEKQLVVERTARAKEFGVDLKGNAPLAIFGELEEALDAGIIDTDAFAVNMGLLAANKHGEVKKSLEAAAVMQQLVELRSTGVIGEPMFAEAEQELKDGKVKQVQKFIDGWNNVTPPTTGQAGAATGAGTQATTAAAPDASATSPATANQPGASGGQPVRAAPVPAVQQPVAESSGALSTAPATVVVGRTGREQTLTKEQLRAKIAAANPVDRLRILDAMGMEQDQDPTTGEPVFLQVAEPRTFDQVAELESQRTGKKVSKQAISQALLKFGIKEGTIDAAVGTTADTVTEAELGIDPAADGSGFRTETQLSKATGQGLVEGDAPLNKKQKAAVEAADQALAAAPTEKTSDRYDPAADESLAKRQEAAQAELASALAGMMNRPGAELAAQDWNDAKFDGAPDFADLTPSAQLEFLVEHYEQTKDTGNEWQPIEELVQRLSKEQLDTAPRTTSAAARPGVRGETAVAAQESRGSRPDQAQAKVDPAKEAWDRERATVPQMPAFEALNERQQGRVADMVSRETFNLAAANTIAGDINQDVLGADVPLNRDVLESRSAPNSETSTKGSAPVNVEFEDIETGVSGAEAVRGQLADLGIESALDLVRDWKLISDANDPTEGEISHEYGTYTITLNVGGNMHPKKVGRTIRHEVAHAMDMAPHGGIYSVQPDLRVRVINGRVFGVGPVAAEIVNLARRDRDIGAYLAYPLDLSRFGAELSQSERISLTDRIQMELYAQMMALYTTDANVREWLADEAPATAKFLAATIKDFQNAPKRQIKKSEDALARRNAYAVQNSGGGGRRVPPAPGQNQSQDGPEKGLKSIGPGPKQVGIPSIDRAPEAIGKLFQGFKDGSSWLGIRTMFTEDLIALADKIIPGGSVRSYKSAMDRIEVARGRMERDVVKILQDFRTLPAHEQAKGPGSVNGLLMDSTMQREWAFQPDWLSKPVTLNPALAARFNGMSADGQALVKRVFKHGHDTLQQMQAAVQTNVAAEYDAAIAVAKEAGDTRAATKLTNKKASEIKDFQSMLDMRSSWPYAPLKRFGKHVVMGYSAEYAAAKAANDKTTMQRLQKDGDHYFVGFAETKTQARAMLAEIAPTFEGGDSGTFEKLDGAEEFMGGRDMMGAFQRLRTLAADQKDDADPKTAGRIDTMMRQMYLTLLAESSARKSEIHRRNVAGADGDMMRAFATQGRATAHFVAGLQTNGKVNDLLHAMKNDASKTLGDREQKQAYFNEIMRRHSMNLEYTPSGAVEKAMAGTSVWMLLTNPSYFLVNMTQPFMMSSPLMGARFGYARAHAEMFRAYREVAPILKNAKFTEDDYSTLPKDTRQAIEELANMGVIDISLESVLGQFESATGTVASKLDPVMQRLRGAAQGVEALNRITTAMAAYRMAKVDSGHDAAVKYAAQVIYETHGDYSGFNAPRFMRRGVGKLATQFRKFQLIQLSMFARLLNTAFKGASTEERFIAKKALAFNLAHLGAAGGLMGMPAFSMIAWVVGHAFGADDEPKDPEATLRRLIGDQDLADLLLKGAPKLLGVDISGRVGAGGMLSLLPYTDLEMSREGYYAALAGALGPFLGGLMPKAVDGMGQIAQGNVWKGTEQMLPTGLANVMKATRFTTDGLTKRNGDVVLSADEVSFLDAIGQAVGLPTNVTTDRQFLANAQYKADQFYRERTSQLKNQYAAAVRKNDTDTMRDVRTEWMDTQAARRKLGYTVQPLSALLKAPQEQRKREASTQAGIQTSRSNAGFVAPLQ